MDELEGFQRRHLRGLAHPLRPVVAKTEAELVAHELIKVRFLGWKDTKKELLAELSQRTRAELVGVVGHVGILFRQNREPKQRKIRVPARPRGAPRPA